MMDLYAVLGVPRDADRAAIRRAYRAKARRAHPDAGGSAEQFAQIKTADDTLIEEARRRRYDETGEAAEVPINNRRAELIGILSAGLDAALVKLSRSAMPAKHTNLARLTSEALSRQRQEWIGQRGQFERAAQQSGELLGRFITPARDNLMEAAVHRRVAHCQKEIATLDNRIKMADEALEMLREMAFRADDDPRFSLNRQWSSIAELVRRFG